MHSILLVYWPTSEIETECFFLNWIIFEAVKARTYLQLPLLWVNAGRLWVNAEGSRYVAWPDFYKVEKIGSRNRKSSGFRTRSVCEHPLPFLDRVLIQKKPIISRICDHCSRQRFEFVDISGHGCFGDRWLAAKLNWDRKYDKKYPSNWILQTKETQEGGKISWIHFFGQGLDKIRLGVLRVAS